ncbi:MAG: hypothetical protein V1888_01670 [archaeon]
MKCVVGIESTAHTFGVGVVDMKGKILSNVKDSYTTEEGGMIPLEVRAHHVRVGVEVFEKALERAGVCEDDIECVAFSNAPGLAPCLLEGMNFAKGLAERLDVPLVSVNHCVAHLVIGESVGAKDPVMLYTSGANTQVIAFEGNRFRVFGETLDLGVGNFIDTIGRSMGLGFPAGPRIEKLALEYGEKNGTQMNADERGLGRINFPKGEWRSIIDRLNNKGNVVTTRVSSELGKYKVGDILKFEDFVLKVANAEMFSKLKEHPYLNELDEKMKNEIGSYKEFDVVWLEVYSEKIEPRTSADFRGQDFPELLELPYSVKGMDVSFSGIQTKIRNLIGKEDNGKLAFALQETVFAMLVEVSERALAHTGKTELLLGGGVGCNSRLVEMCRKMCEERGCKLFVPDKSLLTDNGAMIGYLGLKMFRAGMGTRDYDSVDIAPSERTDEVEVLW